MKRNQRFVISVLIGCMWMAAFVAGLRAQITNMIQAQINHSFVVGDKTLPPGAYSFLVQSDGNLMTIRNSKGDNVGLLMVRESILDHTPTNSEIMFRKYGDTEFLSRIFQGGSKTGVRITETSKEEERLMKAGQKPAEHSEAQGKTK